MDLLVKQLGIEAGGDSGVAALSSVPGSPVDIEASHSGRVQTKAEGSHHRLATG